MTRDVIVKNTFDLESADVRSLNQQLQQNNGTQDQLECLVNNTHGKHAIAVGIDSAANVNIDGHVGYYCAGMNKLANITISGNAGPGVAENMMSGRVTVKGNASQYAGASGHGGLLVIEGDAAARCGISMKGIDIVVGGSIGHMGAFLGQAGNLVICGDAGDSLGDSVYEVQIFVHGSVKSLGTDCIEKEMTTDHIEKLRGLLQKANINADATKFKRYGSARNLYNFNIDNASLT